MNPGCRLPRGDDAALVAASILSRTSDTGLLRSSWAIAAQVEIERRSEAQEKESDAAVPAHDLMRAQADLLVALTKLDQVMAIVQKWWQDPREVRDRVVTFLKTGKETA